MPSLFTVWKLLLTNGVPIYRPNTLVRLWQETCLLLIATMKWLKVFNTGLRILVKINWYKLQSSWEKNGGCIDMFVLGHTSSSVKAGFGIVPSGHSFDLGNVRVHEAERPLAHVVRTLKWSCTFWSLQIKKEYRYRPQPSKEREREHAWSFEKQCEIPG